jgi:hypothetical protein
MWNLKKVRCKRCWEERREIKNVCYGKLGSPATHCKACGESLGLVNVKVRPVGTL